MRWVGNVARMGKRKAHAGFWWGKPRERDTWKTQTRLKDNINMDLQEMGCVCMDWIYLAQDRDRCTSFVNSVMDLRSPICARNFLTSFHGLNK